VRRRRRSSSTTRPPFRSHPHGYFEIDETLASVPAECASPVLLIRNTGGVWFAAGVPKLGENE